MWAMQRLLCRRIILSHLKHPTQSAFGNHGAAWAKARCVSSLPWDNARVSAEEVQAAERYCRDLVKNFDAPAYTLIGFTPPKALTAYTAIRAFNLEIARVPDTVSNSTLANMRYQFWRTTIEQVFADNTKPPRHPVAITLARALHEMASYSTSHSTLSKGFFLRIIAAREQYGMGDRSFPTLEALERYAENTYSSLLYLTLQSYDIFSLTADHVASHVGKACGISAMLSGLPLLAFPSPPPHHSAARLAEGTAGAAGPGMAAQRGSVVALPMDTMAQTGVRAEDILREGSSAAGLKDAVFEVATRASDQLITAREMVKSIQSGSDPDHAYEEPAEEHGPAVQGNQSAFGSASSRFLDSITTAAPRSADDKALARQREIEQGFAAFLPAVATQMWLDKLQKYDFDVFRPELRRRDWKLPIKAYLTFRNRVF